MPNRSRDSGQTLLELVILLAIMSTVTLQIYGLVNQSLRSGILGLNAEIEKNLTTGGFKEVATQYSN